MGKHAVSLPLGQAGTRKLQGLIPSSVRGLQFRSLVAELYPDGAGRLHLVYRWGGLCRRTAILDIHSSARGEGRTFTLTADVFAGFFAKLMTEYQELACGDYNAFGINGLLLEAQQEAEPVPIVYMVGSPPVLKIPTEPPFPVNPDIESQFLADT